MYESIIPKSDVHFTHNKVMGVPVNNWSTTICPCLRIFILSARSPPTLLSSIFLNDILAINQYRKSA